MSGYGKGPVISPVKKPKKGNGRTSGQLVGYLLAVCAVAIAIVIYCSSTSKQIKQVRAKIVTKSRSVAQTRTTVP